MASAPNTIAIARALRLIRADDAVVSVVVEKDSTGSVLATVEVKTELPSPMRNLMKGGESNNFPRGLKRT
ncbi:hypothetical protein [Bradyrhizobium sp. DASA03120]|uniref:hypothetical protein n=1 Tax=Bradyrhizobium sp. SMVTL-02 TaxID=3395917 RepID=UPI003F6EAA30